MNEIEIKSILEELTKIVDDSILEFQTVSFLEKEANRLLEEQTHDNLSHQQREIITNQLAALKRRMEIEVDNLTTSDSQLQKLENRLNKLN
jgi:hypothetical protein